MCVQPYSTTLFGVPLPLPTPQGAGIGNSGTSPRPRFEGCARQPSGHEATSANLFRKECQGCNEARKPSCPAPQFNLPRRLSPPSHGSADRRLRPVLHSSPHMLCSWAPQFLMLFTCALTTPSMLSLMCLATNCSTIPAMLLIHAHNPMTTSQAFWRT